MPKLVTTAPVEHLDMIRVCCARLESVSPYSSSRHHDAPLAHAKEAKDEYELRTWREKATVNDEGIICIPGMAFKHGLDTAASRLSMKVPGKRMGTYTKHFKGGVLVPDLVPLGVSKEDAEPITIYAHADGRRGSGSRVPRTFPIVRRWSAQVEFHIIDGEIAPDVFERHLREMGFFVGVGRFRPENGGTNGRFKLLGAEWSERTLDQLMAA